MSMINGSAFEMKTLNIKFLGDHTENVIVRMGKHSTKRRKDDVITSFLKTFAEDEVFDRDMEMIEGLDNRYKFVIKDNSDNKIVIRNVTMNDPYFKTLKEASTIRVKQIDKIKGAIALVTVLGGLTIIYNYDKLPHIGGNNVGTETERNYKDDYNQMQRYYRKLLKGEISPAEVYDFEDTVNYYLEKNNLSEEDESLIRKYKYEIENYKLGMNNIVKNFTY